MIKIVNELENLTVMNEKMIYKLARSISINHVEDLFQVGVIGLIDAYKKYDPSKEVKFSTYAYSFILGEMKKYIRDNNGIKVSRDILYLSKRLDRLIELLCQKYHRMPTTKELSIETSIDEWKIIEALSLRNCIKSLDEPSNKDSSISLIDTVKDSYNMEDEVILNDMFSILDDDEKNIIYERYFNDRSQSEIADMTGYSQAKVSRKEQKIYSKLKKYYSE